jgi:hypothetical protein
MLRSAPSRCSASPTAAVIAASAAERCLLLAAAAARAAAAGPGRTVPATVVGSSSSSSRRRAPGWGQHISDQRNHPARTGESCAPNRYMIPLYTVASHTQTRHDSWHRLRVGEGGSYCGACPGHMGDCSSCIYLHKMRTAAAAAHSLHRLLRTAAAAAAAAAHSLHGVCVPPTSCKRVAGTAEEAGWRHLVGRQHLCGCLGCCLAHLGAPICEAAQQQRPGPCCCQPSRGLGGSQQGTQAAQ